MKKLVIIIFLFIQVKAFSQDSDSTNVIDIKEKAWTLIGGGIYIHGMSCIFLSKSFRNQDPFIYTNIAAVQLDLLGIYNLIKARKIERKLNKHYKIKLQ